MRVVDRELVIREDGSIVRGLLGGPRGEGGGT